MLGLVHEDEQARIAYMRADDFAGLHMGLDQWVRNHLGPWGKSKALVGGRGDIALQPFSVSTPY